MILFLFRQKHRHDFNLNIWIWTSLCCLPICTRDCIYNIFLKCFPALTLPFFAKSTLPRMNADYRLDCKFIQTLMGFQLQVLDTRIFC